MIRVKLGSKKFRLPASWAECTRAHALTFVGMIFYSGLRDTDIQQFSNRFRIQVLRALISDHTVRHHDFFSLKSWQVTALLEKIDFLFNDICLVPVVPHIPGGLYLPDARLTNSSFIEFAFADEYFSKISTEEDDGAMLDNLVLALCRPKKRFYFIRRLFGDKDPRQPFDSKHLERDISKIPVIYKTWVYFFYMNFRKYLTDKYPALFHQNTSGGQSSTADYGWLGILTSLAKEGIFGDWENTARSNVHTVLFALSYNQDVYQESIRKMKSKSNQ